MMSARAASIAALVLAFLAAAAVTGARAAPESSCPGYATAEEAVRAAADYARGKGLAIPAEEPAASWFGPYWAVRFYATPRKEKGGVIDVDISPGGEIAACWLKDGAPCVPTRDRSRPACNAEGTDAMGYAQAREIAAAHLDRHGITHYPADRPPVFVPEAGWMVQFPGTRETEPFTVSVTADGKARNLIPGL